MCVHVLIHMYAHPGVLSCERTFRMDQVHHVLSYGGEFLYLYGSVVYYILVYIIRKCIAAVRQSSDCGLAKLSFASRW